MKSQAFDMAEPQRPRDRSRPGPANLDAHLGCHEKTAFPNRVRISDFSEVQRLLE
jgi:hypothetical protein